MRVGAAAEPQALDRPHVRPCMGAGRRMPGFVMVEPAGLSTSADLKSWVAMARAYVETLPPKVLKKPVKAPRE